jgi:hypothetical protein
MNKVVQCSVFSVQHCYYIVVVLVLYLKPKTKHYPNWLFQAVWRKNSPSFAVDLTQARQLQAPFRAQASYLVKPLLNHTAHSATRFKGNSARLPLHSATNLTCHELRSTFCLISRNSYKIKRSNKVRKWKSCNCHQ